MDEAYERFFGASGSVWPVCWSSRRWPLRSGATCPSRAGSARWPAGSGTCCLAPRCSDVSAAESAPQGFDLRGPICPPGTTVLEASAGTGKTYTIAALAARYVAEGRARPEPADARHIRPDGDQRASDAGPGPADQRGAGACAGLSRQCGGRPTNRRRRRGPTSWVSRWPTTSRRSCAPGTPRELADRSHRIARALSDFDAATIATTHEFCLRMLDELGVLGGSRTSRHVRRALVRPDQRRHRRRLSASLRRQCLRCRR